MLRQGIKGTKDVISDSEVACWEAHVMEERIRTTYERRTLTLEIVPILMPRPVDSLHPSQALEKRSFLRPPAWPKYPAHLVVQSHSSESFHKMGSIDDDFFYLVFPPTVGLDPFSSSAGIEFIPHPVRVTVFARIPMGPYPIPSMLDIRLGNVITYMDVSVSQLCYQVQNFGAKGQSQQKFVLEAGLRDFEFDQPYVVVEEGIRRQVSAPYPTGYLARNFIAALDYAALSWDATTML
ncbi:hypothetical protein ACRALDRAFT_205721 [Sodiomyces alcalophilus JCM 7366]|uniref:uncharacterized protein n=1 Tax=Sodiomyces alcalophilus JCM 7366 TaxID=591952 RepID=UPI0039B38153